MKDLNISLVQMDIFWHDAIANRALVEELISQHVNKTDLIILPEMFATGFTNDTNLAEPMNGITHKWLKQMAKKYQAYICAGMSIRESDVYKNRMLWVSPEGNTTYYDKHHLFSYAEEEKHYVAGQDPLIIDIQGWKICSSICYDIRFPEWLRNQYAKNEFRYDVLVNIANWPCTRQKSWEILLQARAIENQAYVVGVNRVGKDGRGLDYIGGSMGVKPGGDIIIHLKHDSRVTTFTLDKDYLDTIRQRFPYLKDRKH